MNDVAGYAQPLLETDLRPDLVVFAINPFHLMDPPPLQEGFINNLQQEQTIAELMGFWFYFRRGDIKHAVERELSNARQRLFEFFDVRLDESGLDPWRETVRMAITQTSTDAGWQAKIRQYGLRGYYNPDAYLRSRAQGASLIELVTEFRSRDAGITIVLMPEHSLLRQRMPPAAMDALVESLSSAFGDQLPLLIDLQDAIPDSGFADISHLNEDGSEQFSLRLAEVISQCLSTRAAAN